MALIHQWLLDETSGTTAYDNVGSSDLTNYNCTIDHAGPKAGMKAYYFNGTDAVCRGALLMSDLPANDFTFCTWISVPAFGGDYGVMGNHNVNVGFILRANTPGRNYIYYGPDLTGTLAIGVSPTWYHVAATKSSTAGVVLYLNAATDNSNAGMTGNIGAQSQPFCIGLGYYRPSAGQWGYGYISDARIYDTALTQSEVQAVYDSTPYLIRKNKLIFID